MGFFLSEQALENPKKQLHLAREGGCAVCPLHSSYNKNISSNIPPTGSTSPAVYILGEGVEKEDDARGEHFVGETGKVLKEVLFKYISPSLTRFNNVCRCRLNDHRLLNDFEIECCRKSIEKDIEETKPLIIIGLGSVPLKWGVGVGVSITGWRGRVFPVKIGTHTCWFLSTYSPALILKKRKGRYTSEQEKLFHFDIKNVLQGKLHVYNKAKVEDKDTYFDGVEVIKEKDETKVLQRLKEFEKEKVVSLDIETTGLISKGNKIISIAISAGVKTIAFPIETSNDIYTKSILQALKEFLLKSGIKVCHNLKFELTWFYDYFGKEVVYETKWSDTVGRAYALDERNIKGDGLLSLDTLCRLHFGFFLKNLSNIDRSKMSQYPLEKILPYNALDAKYTFKLWEEQEKRFNERGEEKRKWVGEHLSEVAKTLVLTQSKGLLISQPTVNAYIQELNEKLEKVKNELNKSDEVEKFKKMYKDFNPGSPKQVSLFCKEVLKLQLTQGTANSEEDDEGWEEEKGEEKFTTNKNVLYGFAEQSPIINLLIEYREITKLLGTYLERFKIGNKGSYVGEDSILHTQFNHCYTSTGRLCVAKGTMIEVVRDLSKHPKGIPIEEVKEGDLVYSFDNNRKAVLRKVLWGGKTGIKEVIRVHWLGSGKRHKGYLDVTPEHPIRLVDGTYKKAIELKKGDRVLAVHRTNPSRIPSQLYVTGYPDCFPEHRFICEQLYNTGIPLTKTQHVHHKDHNPFNNLADNLKILTETSHKKYHSHLITKSQRWRENNLKAIEKRRGKYVGENSKNYVKLTKWQCLRIVGTFKGCLINSEHDYEVTKDRCERHNIDHISLRLRYCGRRKEYVSKTKLLNLLKENNNNFLKVCSLLKCDYYKFKKLLKHYNIPYFSRKTKVNLTENDTYYKRKGRILIPKRYACNHIISGIETLNKEVEVYDLEVEETHNFIANEICVHNSSQDPNVQNLPRRKAKYIRSIFVPPDNHLFVAADLGQIEARCIAFSSKDEKFCEAIRKNYDIHKERAIRVASLYPSAAKVKDVKEFEEFPKKLKEFRDLIKNKFTFPLFYGASYKSIARDLVVTEEVSKKVCDETFDMFKGVKKWQKELTEFYNKYGYVESLVGRRRHAPMTLNAILNSPIQSIATDIMLKAMINLSKTAYISQNESLQPNLTVHDEVGFYLPNDDTLEDNIQVIAKEMVRINFTFINVPLSVEIKVGRNWGEAEDVGAFTTDDFTY